MSSKAQLTVSSPVTNAQVISALAGSGVSISNLTINCPSAAYGTFNAASTNIGIAGGLLMTTGEAINAIGPNNLTSEGTMNGASFSDPDLLALEPLADNDVCIIEFDITPSCNQLSLSYVFGSEEYPEFVCATYDDVFGFFITGPNPAGGSYASQNIATIPSTTIPVAINSVNPGVSTGGGSCISLAYSQYYVDNTGGTSIQYDGFTVPLTASVNVVPCTTYHMKLGIADAGDESYDSGVFLTYQGLTCTPSPLVVSPARNICAGQSTTITATGATSYTWSPTATLTYVNDSTMIAAPTVTTTYTVTGNNSSGCGIGQGTIIVNVGQLDQPSFNVVDATCVCDGSATVIPSPTPNGGTAPFSYVWSNSQLTQTASALCPGSYTVTLSDALGCSATASVSIGVTGGPVNSTTKQNVLCNSTPTGSAVVTPTSGTPPYLYSWSNGDLDSVATNLLAGIYTVLVTDMNGCQSQSTVTITEPALLTIAPSQVDVLCKGMNTGSATAGINGGVGPYLFSWSNGATTATASNLAAGNYNVVVTDINGCQAIQNYAITEPLTGLDITSTTDSLTCSNSSDGAAYAVVTGGTQPYSYNWVPGPVGLDNDTATGLAEGMYMVVVTDNQGCVIRDTVEIFGPTPITVSYAVAGTLCAGTLDGSAISTASGGTPGYTYSWETGTLSPTLFGVGTGYYTLTITDTLGCQKIDSVFIPEPLPLSLSLTSTSSTCSGMSNGSAQVTVTGGTPGLSGYTYSWSNGTSQQAAQGLGAGQYIAYVTDNNGCAAQDTVTISSETALLVSFNSQDPSCFNTQDGGIKAVVSGGVGPYDILWNTGATTDKIGNLGSGTYTVTVTDLGAESPINVYAEDFDETMNWMLNVSTGANQAGSNVWFNSDAASGVTGSCNNPGVGDSTLFIGQTGQMVLGSVYAPGVTTNVSAVSPMISTVGYGGPLTMTFDYKGGGNALDKASVDVSVDGGQSWINLQTGLGTAVCGTTTDWQAGSFSLPATAENNTAVQFRFVWTNDNDNTGNDPSIAINNVLVTSPRQPGVCTATASQTLTAPSPVAITVTSQVNAICTNNIGSITVSASGGNGGYSYSWNTVPAQLSAMADSLTPNTPYMVTVTDAKGCVKDTVLQVGKDNPALTATLTTQNATCLSASGTATATVTSTATTGPYTYQWTPGAQTSSTATGLTGGASYQVTITDANGCQLQEVVTIGVTNVDLDLSLSTTLNVCGELIGTAKATPHAGTAPYTWIWDAAAGSQSTETATGLDEGTYHVTVKDANGCESDTTVSVQEILGVTAAFTTDATNGIAPASIVFTNTSTGAGSYLWNFDNGITSTQTSPTQEFGGGTYNVVLHAYGAAPECEDTASIRIVILDKLEIYIPNVFAPGSSAQNKTFRVTAQGVLEYNATIFDRWGKKVFESTSLTDEWDGDGSSAGTYYYIIKVKGTDLKEPEPFTGFITLIK